MCVLSAAGSQVAVDGGCRLGDESECSDAVALSDDGEGAGIEVDVRDGEPHDLGSSDAGPSQHGDDGGVAVSLELLEFRAGVVAASMAAVSSGGDMG